MKLYTEEQVRKAIEDARDTHQEGRPYLERDVYDYSYDEIINMLTSIELPSDKEMDKFLLDNSYEYGYGYRDAIDWVKKQILNQNK